MQVEGWFGLRGWQVLFVVEAIPAVILGLATFFVLPDRPAKAKWLTPEQRDWLSQRLDLEQSGRKQAVGHLLTNMCWRRRWSMPARPEQASVSRYGSRRF